MIIKYTKKKMIVGGKTHIVERCLAVNGKKTQCKQPALKDHARCRDHYMTCTDWRVDSDIIDDVEPEAAEYIAVDFGFRDATAVSVHAINDEKARKYESRERWSKIVHSIVNFR